MGTPRAIALDTQAGKLYWISADPQSIQRANLDGSAIEDFIPQLVSWPCAIAVDSDHGFVYWTEWSKKYGTSILRSKVDAPVPMQVIAVDGRIEHLTVAPETDELRWSTSDYMFRSGLDGSDCRIVHEFSHEEREDIDEPTAGCGGCYDSTKWNLRFLRSRLGDEGNWNISWLMNRAYTQGVRFTGAVCDVQSGGFFLSSSSELICGLAASANPSIIRARLDGTEFDDLVYSHTGCQSIALDARPIEPKPAASFSSDAWPLSAICILVIASCAFAALHWRHRRNALFGADTHPEPVATSSRAHVNKTRRIAKMGFALSVTLAVVWVATLFGYVGYSGWNGFISLGRGALHARFNAHPVPSPIRDRFVPESQPNGWTVLWRFGYWWAEVKANSFWNTGRSLMGLKWPRFQWGRSWGGSLELPLWVPLVALLPLSTFFWWTDRRRSLAGSCQQCGYNLTGNTSGRCPECGQPCTSHAQTVTP